MRDIFQPMMNEIHRLEADATRIHGLEDATFITLCALDLTFRTRQAPGRWSLERSSS
jgi:hypothetical protein